MTAEIILLTAALFNAYKVGLMQPGWPLNAVLGVLCAATLLYRIWLVKRGVIS